MLIHQSSLSQMARCAAAAGYQRAGLPTKQTSAAAYGSVMHFAILIVLERALHEARITHHVKSVEYARAHAAATKSAVDTFVHYWNPLNISVITEPVANDGWLPRQGYSELRTRGIEAIRRYADLIRWDDHELLATEYTFQVPIPGTWDEDLGEPHILAGAVDRLAARYYLQKLAVSVDDIKTGIDQKYLRWNQQFTAYSLATTLPEFWVGWNGEDGFGEERGRELYERFNGAGRRATWINLRTFKYQDAGWRGPQDYARFALAVEQFVATVKADIYPLSISGATCRFCDFRAVCGGTGIPAENHGAPPR